MKKPSSWIVPAMIMLAALVLAAACGGGGNSGPQYTPGVTTLAGPTGGAGCIDAVGPDARFNYPDGVTTDGTNLYVTDSNNHTIRKIVISTGEVTTFSGKAGENGTADGIGADARFTYPRGITTDGTNLFVADSGNHTIRKIVLSTGEVSTFAGTATASGFGDGIGTAASFNAPRGITADGANLYVADTNNHTIRKIVISSGKVSTLAGTAGVPGSIDATGINARFLYPYGITADGTYLYVSDTANHIIRKIAIGTGEVTTLAGTAGSADHTDAIGADARFFNPNGILTDGTNLFVADQSSCTIRQIVISTGEVTTLAGWADRGSIDGIGIEARFNNPYGITTDGTNLYVTDTFNNIIRKIVIITKEVTTLAGTAASTSDSMDGIGADATFFHPRSITTDGANLYVADGGHSTIRRIALGTGTVTTLAGAPFAPGPTDATGIDARFNQPAGITSDGTHLLIADTGNHAIRQIVLSTGEVTTLAGTAEQHGVTDGFGADARFHFPRGIASDGTNLYVADTGNHTIRKIVVSTGEVTTLAGAAGQQGHTDAIGTNARFMFPHGITTDGANLYVTDSYNHTIRKIAIDTGEVTTLAGAWPETGSTDGFGADARFYFPRGIATDGMNLYVTDTNNHTIRKIVISTGEVTTLSGKAGEGGTVDGSWSDARFFYPEGITASAAGLPLYVANTRNHNIRKIY